MRSSSATTELPFCTYFFLTKANLPCTRAESLLHFSKLQEREGSRFTHTFLTQSVTSPPAHNGGSPSSHLYLVYLSNYLFPRFYSDLVRQTQTVTRERKSSMHDNGNGSRSRVWVKSARGFRTTHTIFGTFAKPNGALSEPGNGGCCSLRSSFRRIRCHDRFYLG